MSFHQIIYTSCMRGISGVNDGQQIFSYDAQFKDANNDEVKSMFSYQPPALAPGEVMTEEIAAMMPRSFTFRKLKNGACALAQNTYLGRDYMGSTGRFGNFLSHVVLGEETDWLCYPCEYYGGSLLRDHMEFEEVNNPDRPDYLPVPVPERGYAVDVDAVIDFLGIEGHMEIFQNMVHAMLSFEAEKKRVVICDEPGNIVYWIAALEYVLPLKNALGINFTTYAFDPSLSAARICGVLPGGTRYNSETRGYHFSFDLYTGEYPELDKDDEFSDFIDMAMSFSYDSLQAFHQFLTTGYSYDGTDLKLYDAYRLYVLLHDGISALPLEKIAPALQFAEEYAFPGEQMQILNTILEQKDELAAMDRETFFCVMRYVATQYGEQSPKRQKLIRDLMTQRVLAEYLSGMDGEEAFLSIYREAEEFFRSCGASIAEELMNNQESLFAVMQNDMEMWKIAFIVRVVSSYAKEQRVSVDDLLPDAWLGGIYDGLIRAVYSKSERNGVYLVTLIMDEFSDDATWLTNLTLNLEGMLHNIPGGAEQTGGLWNYAEKILTGKLRGQLDMACEVLIDCQRYEEVFRLYSRAMSAAPDLAESKKLFRDHLKMLFDRDRRYAAEYGEGIMECYYEKLRRYDPETAREAREDLFYQIRKRNLKPAFIGELADVLAAPIPFESPQETDRHLILDIWQYLISEQMPAGNRLLLLYIGVMLEDTHGRASMAATLSRLEETMGAEPADLRQPGWGDAMLYLKWVLPHACEICVHYEEMDRLYHLFRMPQDITKEYLLMCAKAYFKLTKKDYGPFREFLGLIFAYGGSDVREEVGKMLCGLGKQKLADLDQTVKRAYREDREALSAWNEIRRVAESTNPLLNNLTKVFKRK